MHQAPPESPIRSSRTIALASPLARRRRAWREALESRYAVHEVSRVTLLGRSVAALRPAVALVDDRLLAGGLAAGIGELRRRSPSTKIILADSRLEPRAALEALRAGARGTCPADATPALLRRAVRRVIEGEVWVSRRIVASLVEELSSVTEARQLGLVETAGPERREHAPVRLSPREADVVRLVAGGRSNRAIAGELGLAEKTVKAHLTAVFRKLRVSSRLQLAILARRAHLAS